MIQLLFTALVILVPASLWAQPDPKESKKPDPEKLVTRIHDLKGVLNATSRPAEFTDPDAIVRFMVEAVHFGDIKVEGEGPQIIVRDNGKLEVRATEKVQSQVKDFLEALARLGEFAIDAKADLIELDRDAFEKEVKPLLKPAKGKTDPAIAVAFSSSDRVGAEKPLPLAAAEKIAKAGKVIQTSSGRYSNGAESIVSARHTVFTYRTQPGAGPLLAKEGYRLGALMIMSGDRRFVRVRLTEQAAEVVGTKKRDFGMFTATTPDITEHGRSTTIEIEDGGAILFKLDYAPKEKVWVVLLKPVIFIQAEEDARKKEPKK